MRTALALLLLAAPLFAATTNNDDSCDVALQPAATLLLPYFDVDVKTRAATTLITLQNVSPKPAIANVTLWTDWGFPVVNFPVHLTGYDVQGINLYDVLALGNLPPTECHAGNIAPSILPDVQSALTIGGSSACKSTIGFFHLRAIGYATIDVVSSCAAKNGDLFSTLFYDNVLTGDYQQLQNGVASGGPLVHIRAVPEGGAAGAVVATQLPHTFYERFMPDPLALHADRRQPLPSAFTPRVLNSDALRSTLKIWREGITTGACSGAQAASSNANMPFADAVRFDEHENATIAGQPLGISVTGAYPNTAALFPPLSPSGDAGGWLYLNTGGQSWMTVAMFGAPTYATEATAPALGNGCSPAVAKNAQIGPRP
jgi:hypothetical protein